MADHKVNAPMIGKIVKILVKLGDKVAVNAPVLTLEAMKMEMPVTAPVAGTIKEIKVAPEQTVESDTVLAIIES